MRVVVVRAVERREELAPGVLAVHEDVVVEEALRLDPSSEYFHRERIRALGYLGDRSGAWNAFQDCRDGLGAKGLDPGPETMALVERAVGVSASRSSGEVEDGPNSPRC